MIGTIPSPVSGGYLQASWAQKVTDACNASSGYLHGGTLVRDGAGAFGNAPLPVNQRNRTVRNPLPFLVAWRSDVGDSGGLAVYLPNEHLLMVDGEYVSIGGVSSVDGVPDWFAIDDGNRDAAHVWLLVTEDHDQVSASVTCAESPEGDLCICLAEVVHPESESSDRPPTVRQSVVGAIVLGVGTGDKIEGDDEGLTGDYDIVTGSEYDLETHRFVNKVSRLHFERGLLTAVSEQTDQEVFESVEHVDHGEG